MGEQLTDRQRQVLRFIIDSARETGFSPTVREIAGEFGFRSPKAASDHLAALERKGYIRRTAGRSRAIELTDEVRIDRGVPIIGRVAAGTPIMAEENYEGVLDLQEVFGRDDVFALRVDGESMIDAGICDGDYVIVRRQDVIRNGEIGVAYIENDATVKRIFDEGDRFRLQPENANMDPIMVSSCDPDFRVGGKVLGVVRAIH